MTCRNTALGLLLPTVSFVSLPLSSKGHTILGVYNCKPYLLINQCTGKADRNYALEKSNGVFL